MARLQPVCKGVDEKGELIWAQQVMERWQELQLYFRSYEGNMLTQWMELVNYQKAGWDMDPDGGGLYD